GFLHRGQRKRQAAQCLQGGCDATQSLVAGIAGVVSYVTGELADQAEVGKESFGSAALERELVRHLAPAIALATDESVVRHEGVVEMHFIEASFSRDVGDLPT